MGVGFYHLHSTHITPPDDILKIIQDRPPYADISGLQRHYASPA